MVVYRVPSHSQQQTTGPVSRVVGPLAQPTAAPVTGTAAGSLAVVGAALGVRDTTGVAAGSLTIVGVAAGVRGTTGVAAGSLTIVGTGSGITAAAGEGVATGTLAIVGAAAGVRNTNGTATGSLTIIGAALAVRNVNGVAAGTITIVGSAVVGLVVTYPYPVAVSGRKLVDQNSDPFLICQMSSWAMTQHGTTAEITFALEALKELGFNSVMIWPCGGYLGGGWVRYEQLATGEDFFVGTPLASALGPAWATVDHFMDECVRLELVPVISIYTGAANDQGIGTDLIAVGTTNAYNYGHAIATRYANYPNFMWHYGADENFDYGTAPSQVVDAVFHGIRDAEGSTHRLVLNEPQHGRTSYSQFISQEGTSGSGYEWLKIDVNGLYDYTWDTVDNVNGVYNESGATTLPVWDCEIPYRGATWTPTPSTQELRERNYASFLGGFIGLNYGDNDFWQFGVLGLGGGSGDAAWQAALSRAETVEAGIAFVFLREHVNTTDFAPSTSFIVTGTGTGDTKAAQGVSATCLVAYFPSSRTVQVNTTLFPGSVNVRIRWFNPVAATYTVVAASEAQSATRTVSYPSNHADGADWVLLVDGGGVEGAATGSITIVGSATGVRTMVGTAAGSLTISGTSTGIRNTSGTAAGSLSIIGAAVGVHNVNGAATGSLTIVGVALGVRNTAGAAAGSITIVGTAAGIPAAAGEGVAAGTISIVGGASGVRNTTATAAGSLTLVGAAVGQHGVNGAATGSLAIVGVGLGQAGVVGTATGSLTIVGVSLGLGEGQAVGTAQGSITIVGTAVGVVTPNVNGAAVGQLALTGAAVGRRGVAATVAGTLAVIGVAAAIRGVNGTATGSIIIVGTAVVPPPFFVGSASTIFVGPSATTEIVGSSATSIFVAEE